MAITKSTETFTAGDAPSAQDKADLLAAIGAADATSTAAAIAARVAYSEVREYDGGHAFVWQDRAAWPDVIEFLST